jgi:hypothetical protein
MGVTLKFNFPDRINVCRDGVVIDLGRSMIVQVSSWCLVIGIGQELTSDDRHAQGSYDHCRHALQHVHQVRHPRLPVLPRDHPRSRVCLF